MKLEIGYNNLFEIRFENQSQYLNAKTSIAFLSDFHFNKFSSTIIKSVLAELKRLNPSIILLGGDYVDSKKGLMNLKFFLEELKQFKNIFAISGNHDFYFGINEIKKTFSAFNITWLENNSVFFDFDEHKYCISNNPDETIADEEVTAILVIHQPLVLNKISKKFNLVFAGHLHGCQIVFWKQKFNLYPGKFFYKNNFLKLVDGKCVYLISKGLGDTLPIRFNCKKDFIFISN